VLVLVDVFTDFIWLRALRNKSSISVARALFSIFCEFGFPKILQSDCASEFVDDVLLALTQSCGIERRLSPEYRPQTNGKVERKMADIQTLINKLCFDVENNWPIYLPFVALSLNVKHKALTNSSSFALMFGRQHNAFEDYSSATSLTSDIASWVARHECLIKEIYPLVNEQVLEKQKKACAKFNDSHSILSFDMFPKGALVMAKSMYRNSKSEPRYDGVFQVLSRTRSGFLLQDQDGPLDRHFPLEHLKLVQSSAPNIAFGNIHTVKAILDHKVLNGIVVIT
jgi:hypothetical protein